jgi:hypothetical protein
MLARIILLLLVPLTLLNIQCKNGILDSGMAVDQDTLVIKDYEFIKSRIFFIDTVYRDYYEQGFSQDVQSWQFDQANEITELEVFISTSYSNVNAFRGVAAINPGKYIGMTDSDLDTITMEAGKVESGKMISLDADSDYYYDPLKGILILNQSVYDKQFLGVSYRTINKKIGEFSYELTPESWTLVTRLIRPMANRPGYDTWSLTLRNVYTIPDSVYSRNYFKIKIGFQTEDELRFTQNDSTQATYLNLLGLDMVDENGTYIAGGDGIIDDNPHILNKDLGLLFFPGLTPFNPEPGSRFQISEENRANIYHTNNYSEQVINSRFMILCFYPSNK